MNIVKATFKRFSTICSGDRERQIRQEERTNLPPLKPGEFRLFDPACMPILTAQERENIRLAAEAKELSAQE